MSVPDFAQGIQMSFLASMNHAHTKPVVAAAAPAAAGQTASTSGSGISFDDLVDIVNPLQHIPIVSTLYRHFTGDTIKPLEQVAGDTLYGGLVGFGSSVADYAFQKITGKNLGDTVLAFFTGDGNSSSTAVAAAAGSATTPASAANIQTAQATRPPTPLLGAPKVQPIQTADASSVALLAAARNQGVTSDVALRALSAYQRSLLEPAVSATQ